MDGLLDLSDLLGGAGGAGGAELGDGNGADIKAADPVGGNLLAAHGLRDGVGIVHTPVVGGGGQRGVGRGGEHIDVIADGVNGGAGLQRFLAGLGSAGGVSVLADDDAAIGNELLGGLVLLAQIEPGAGVLDFHPSVLIDGLDAQIERGVAGDDLGIGERADIADLDLAVLGLVLGLDLAFLVELGDLHTGDNTGDIARLIDIGEGVGEVVQTRGLGGITGHGDKLDIGELAGGLLCIGLVAIGVGEDDAAARVGELLALIVADFLLGDRVGPHDVRAGGVDAQRGHGLLQAVHVRGGITLRLIANQYDADLDVGVQAGLVTVKRHGLDALRGDGGVFGGLFALSSAAVVAAGDERQNHDERKDRCKELFHSFFLL